MDKDFRIEFDKKTLDEIFGTINKNTTFTQLSENLKISYNTLKHWRRGVYYMPLDVFKKLVLLYPSIQKYEKSGKKIPYYWGCGLGGRKTISKLSKIQLNKRMNYIRSKKTNLYKPININVDNSSVLEFYGILMGDGCISKYFSSWDKCPRYRIHITGNSKKDYNYLNNYVHALIKNTFCSNVYIRKRKGENVIELIISNIELFLWLVKNGFPIGKKGQIRIPRKISALSITKINNLIRGLFDTDGCISARKDEKYKYPYIFISSNSSILRDQLKNLLRKQGINAYIHDKNVVIRGNNNFEKWFGLIGSNNERNLNRYHEWKNTGYLKSVGR